MTARAMPWTRAEGAALFDRFVAYEGCYDASRAALWYGFSRVPFTPRVEVVIEAVREPYSRAHWRRRAGETWERPPSPAFERGTSGAWHFQTRPGFRGASLARLIEHPTLRDEERVRLALAACAVLEDDPSDSSELLSPRTLTVSWDGLVIAQPLPCAARTPALYAWPTFGRRRAWIATVLAACTIGEHAWRAAAAAARVLAVTRASGAGRTLADALALLLDDANPPMPSDLVARIHSDASGADELAALAVIADPRAHDRDVRNAEARAHLLQLEELPVVAEAEAARPAA